jgi:hypothetical protein
MLYVTASFQHYDERPIDPKLFEIPADYERSLVQLDFEFTDDDADEAQKRQGENSTTNTTTTTTSDQQQQLALDEDDDEHQ